MSFTLKAGMLAQKKKNTQNHYETCLVNLAHGTLHQRHINNPLSFNLQYLSIHLNAPKPSSHLSRPYHALEHVKSHTFPPKPSECWCATISTHYKRLSFIHSTYKRLSELKSSKQHVMSNSKKVNHAFRHVTVTCNAG